MHDHVFISHSSKDDVFVNRLASALEGSGISSWVDIKTLQGGDEWMKSVTKAIDRSSTVVFVISPDAMDSSMVSKEIQLAFRRGVDIIPVVLRDAKLAVELVLAIGGAQRIDFTGGQFEDRVKALVQAIRRRQKETSNQKDGASAANLTVYVQDLSEFLPRVPRRMAWQLCRLRGLSFLETMMLVQIFGRPELLRLLMINLIILIAFAAVIYFIWPMPLEASDGIVLISMALSVTVFQWFVMRIIMKRGMERDIPKILPNLSYRPITHTTNVLLDKWEENVKPIVWQLLDEPMWEWTEYIEKRVEDEQLAARVFITISILLSLTTRETYSARK